MDEHEENEPHEDDTGATDELANPLGDVLEIVADQARNHPIRTLGAAFGIGYVLGGGVPSFAMRLLGIAMVRSATSMLDWEGLAESALGVAKSEIRARSSGAPRGRDGHERSGRGRSTRQTTH